MEKESAKEKRKSKMPLSCFKFSASRPMNLDKFFAKNTEISLKDCEKYGSLPENRQKWENFVKKSRKIR